MTSKITVKHGEGLSDSIYIEETINGITNPIRAIKNCDKNWKSLKDINGLIPVMVETDYGFQGSDIREIPLTESIPYIHRFVSQAHARQLSDKLRSIRKVVAKAAGFEL